MGNPPTREHRATHLKLYCQCKVGTTNLLDNVSEALIICSTTASIHVSLHGRWGSADGAYTSLLCAPHHNCRDTCVRRDACHTPQVHKHAAKLLHHCCACVTATTASASGILCIVYLVPALARYPNCRQGLTNIDKKQRHVVQAAVVCCSKPCITGCCALHAVQWIHSLCSVTFCACPVTTVAAN
jgi:hypothetical protein